MAASDGDSLPSVRLPPGRAKAPRPGPPPGLPNVDAHVPRKDLSYEVLFDAVRHQRWHVTERKPPAPPPAEEHLVDDATLGSQFSTTTGPSRPRG